MSIFLSKFLPPLLYPVGLAFILIMLALFIQRRPHLQRIVLIIAVAALWLGGNKWVATALIRSVEWQYLPPVETPHAAAIVLLGGGTASALYPRQEVDLNGAADRMFYAARLYHEGAAPFILASGGRIDWLENGNSAAYDMAEVLDALGVPGSSVWLEEKSQNTAENAAECWKILQPQGIRRIILVTSAFHMPRSIWLFEQQGFDVIPAPTDYGVTQSDWDALFEPDLMEQALGLIPSAGNISDTSRALKEYLGLLVYRLTGPR